MTEFDIENLAKRAIEEAEEMLYLDRAIVTNDFRPRRFGATVCAPTELWSHDFRTRLTEGHTARCPEPEMNPVFGTRESVERFELLIGTALTRQLLEIH